MSMTKELLENVLSLFMIPFQSIIVHAPNETVLFKIDFMQESGGLPTLSAFLYPSATQV